MNDWYEERFKRECEALRWCREFTYNQPTIEPQRIGKWIDYSEDGYVECPFCHSATNCDDNIDELHFCFSCGARLEV